MVFIRTARRTDCGQLAKIMKTWPENQETDIDILTLHLTKNGFSEKPVFSIFIAEDSTRVVSSGSASIVGWVLFSRIYSTWEGRSLRLDTIFVVPEFRRQGVGTALLRSVIQMCRAVGCQRIDCCPRAKNKGLIRLLEKHQARDLNEVEGWSFYQLNRDCMRKLEQQQ
ncbi:thialysine N-epsilon-acetyltransferase-like [Ixodes scapularis]|uniref:thialysine N-epsilon-acetyltransferase-like n=1 Tax=Ixodes scapularis TaxID=6945 RepID=UPI001A9CC34E|nr:thialysine N-epsilon-acetyltransferase-like [Ixodes scapularis]